MNMSSTNQQNEIRQEVPEWKCNYCGFEFSGTNIVCPSCGFADVEEVD